MRLRKAPAQPWPGGNSTPAKPPHGGSRAGTGFLPKFPNGQQSVPPPQPASTGMARSSSGSSAQPTPGRMSPPAGCRHGGPLKFPASVTLPLRTSVTGRLDRVSGRNGRTGHPHGTLRPYTPHTTSGKDQRRRDGGQSRPHRVDRPAQRRISGIRHDNNRQKCPTARPARPEDHPPAIKSTPPHLPAGTPTLRHTNTTPTTTETNTPSHPECRDMPNHSSTRPQNPKTSCDPWRGLTLETGPPGCWGLGLASRARARARAVADQPAISHETVWKRSMNPLHAALDSASPLSRQNTGVGSSSNRRAAWQRMRRSVRGRSGTPRYCLAVILPGVQ